MVECAVSYGCCVLPFFSHFVWFVKLSCKMRFDGMPRGDTFMYKCARAGLGGFRGCFVGVSVAGVGWWGGAVTFCIDFYSTFFRDAFCVPSRFVCFWCWRQYGARAVVKF